MVGLVDAFSHSDTQLRSALGAYDGDVYTRLYAEAKKEPLNQTEVRTYAGVLWVYPCLGVGCASSS